MQEFPKSYDPSAEPELYRFWEERNYFLPRRERQKEEGGWQNGNVFSILLPPPNVTGILHLGHAMMVAIEDILVRFHRMRGDETLWIPGTDHAAIATQERVERGLYKKEKRTRHDLGREAFLERVVAYAKESHDEIVKQIKRLGASLDWSREAFTLDRARSRAVREAFSRMYDTGLIYRGERIVNWDPKLQTTVSDDEVEWEEETTLFYYFRYGPFTIGTARPETKFGDKYVVMHPSDERYAKWKHGDKLEIEWINGKVTATVIKDEAVDPKFGTGVMTITPSHDATDFEIAKRHGLEMEQIIDFRGRLMPIAMEFAEKKILEARPFIVEKLKTKGLLERIDESYVHRIARSSRGGGLIEPQVMKQWFVNVHAKFKIQKSELKNIPSGSETTLKEIMITAVKSGQIKIIPKRFEKVYFHWIENLRDWCISRQIWYGHRIPVWYREKPKSKDQKSKHDDKEIYVGNAAPKGDGWEQDPDTLDTWFSSGIWTFSTLGWPDACEKNQEPKTKNQKYCKPLRDSDLDLYHPISVLETGYDILFFWVARMILMTGFLLGDVPFKTVYLHGLVRDERGRKMSKSLGNTIDPLEMAEKYGADAVRLSFIIGASPGNDVKLSEDRVRGYRNFSTKLWNIARFITFAEIPEIKIQKTKADLKLTEADKKYLKEFEALKETVTRQIEQFKLHIAVEELYHYAWHIVADKIIEEMKPRLTGSDMNDRAAAFGTIVEIFYGTIKLLHPFMPFTTDAIYRSIRELIQASSGASLPESLTISQW